MKKVALRVGLDGVLAILWSIIVAVPGYYLVTTAELTMDGQTAVMAVMPVALALTLLRLEISRRGRSGPGGRGMSEHDEAALFQANLALAVQLLELQRQQGTDTTSPLDGTNPRNLRVV